VKDSIDLRPDLVIAPTDLTDLTDHLVCLDWKGHVLPGVWDSERQAFEVGSRGRYSAVVTTVSRVRDLPHPRQADVSRRYDQAPDAPDWDH